MKVSFVSATILSLWLAGCATQPSPAAKAATAPPAPVQQRPLSTPQTHVELPEAQPVDPAALATEPPHPAPPAATPAATPARTTSPSRRTQPAPVASTPASAKPPEVQPAAAQPPLEPPRPAIEEIVSPDEAKRLQDSAHARRKDAARILQQLGRGRLSATQLDVAASIRNFLALSENAEKRGDMREADALAERAQILAKELQSGQ
jgi:hypothetical protein